ncbi:MAG: 6,7-dimethyl-8-ribityllumazine synthase [Planctomycetota bacterium]|nr:6,7-dimethyl-8-ribityllumazine synthase [Planctomycetota bacterium]MDA1249995.1 6,7-dimethyl-8-ribityllumazine synthase [Planctomycetota bacterium]
MATEIAGNLILNGDAIAVVVARFNDLITTRLLEGAVNTLLRHGGSDENITIVHVPGSFEIPLIADRLAKSGKFAAVICLGAVIQGQTTHHDYINHQLAAGLREASQRSGIPVTFGVLTCQTMEQAIDRAGGKVGNKGNEAALAAIEMISILKKLDEEGITDASAS